MLVVIKDFYLFCLFGRIELVTDWWYFYICRSSSFTKLTIWYSFSISTFWKTVYNCCYSQLHSAFHSEIAACIRFDWCAWVNLLFLLHDQEKEFRLELSLNQFDPNWRFVVLKQNITESYQTYLMTFLY